MAVESSKRHTGNGKNPSPEFSRVTIPRGFSKGKPEKLCRFNSIFSKSVVCVFLKKPGISQGEIYLCVEMFVWK
jgi:hypothetical protein